MESPNKHLERGVAALVVVVIALVMVIMRLTISGHQAAPQTAVATPPSAAAPSARLVSPAPTPRTALRTHAAVAPLPPHPAAVAVVPELETSPADTPPPPAAMLLNAGGLLTKTRPELRLMRNEIYAEHGYRFHTAGLLAHFRAKPWYRPNTESMRIVEGRLSAVETANLALLVSAEERQRRFVQELEATRNAAPPRLAPLPYVKGPPPAVQPPPVVQPPAPFVPSIEASAQVWVDTRSGIYHYPGRRWYGRTKEGQYMAEDAAQRAGYRASRNGQ